MKYFENRVNKSGPLLVKKLGRCWSWTGPVYPKGYGQCWKLGEQYAHRVSYKIAFGEIPKGLFVLHKCDNPNCVRPSHLFLGTHQDNVKDMVNKKRHQFGEKHWSKLKPERRAFGDRNGSRTHPEKLSRGSKHWSNLHPEKISRGDRHWSKFHPERVAKGDKHWTQVNAANLSYGENRFNAKLTVKSVQLCRKLYHQGVSINLLCKKYGITYSAMRAAVLRINWKQVP